MVAVAEYFGVIEYTITIANKVTINERASLTKVFIIRSNDPEQKSVNVKGNAVVRPGDIITVKQSYF